MWFSTEQLLEIVQTSKGGEGDNMVGKHFKLLSHIVRKVNGEA